MKTIARLNYLLLTCLFLGLGCSGDDPGDEGNKEEVVEGLTEADVIGGWQLDRIRVEGADCQTLFGVNVPEVYEADSVGCATAFEILGNASRCVNLDLMAGGEGLYLWSEVTGGEDAAITYEFLEDGVRYCFMGSSCSGVYKLVGDKLELTSELGLDEVCNAVFVLKRK